MLPKKHRINRRLFEKAFKEGLFFAGDNFSGKVYQIPNDLGAGLSKFACVVPKKVVNKAVDRNKLRRMVYQAIHPLLTNIKPGFAVIIIVKTKVLELSQDEIREKIINLLRHFKIYD